MNTKKKFAVSLGLLQVLLFIIFYSAVDGFITPVAAQTAENDPGVYMALAFSAAIVVGFTAIGAGLALKTIATAAISAITEREGSFGQILVMVAMAESLAILGFIVGVLLLGKIP